MSDWNQGPATGGQPPFGSQPAPQQFGVPSSGPAFGGGGAPTFTLAPWIKRVGASLVDFAILFGIAVVGGIVAAIGGSISNSLGLLLAIVLYIGIFAFSIWQHVFVQGKTGKTIGKGVIGIKVVLESNAQPTGPGLAFGRGLCHILDGFFYIGYLWPLWDVKRQTFADKIVHTVVVEA